MNCAVHTDTTATAYCRTCGKPMCPACAHNVRGVVYCEDCLANRIGSAAPAGPAAAPAPVPAWPACWPGSFPSASARFIPASTRRDWLTC